MPTSPETHPFISKLHELIALSSEILACRPEQTEQIQALLNQRESLIEALFGNTPNDLTEEALANVQTLIANAKQQDQLIEQYFKSILSQQAKALREINRTRQALASYKYPSLPQSSGIENRG